MVRQRLASSSPLDDDCLRSMPGRARHRQASATVGKSTWACRTTRCRSCIATSLSLARTRLPAPAVASAIHEPSTRARAQSSGSSARWPSRAQRATRRGRPGAGKVDWARMPGRSISRWTSRAGCSICPSHRRSRATTVAIERVQTCTATPWSRWIYRPAPTSGTSRPFITISGMPTHRLRHRSSTSVGMGVRLLRSRSPRSLDTCTS
jgi:hypothetical protein